MVAANQLPLDGVPIAKESAVPSEVLFDVFGAKRRTRRRPTLLCCGTTKDAKDVAASGIRDVGVERLDAGPPRIARYLEPFSLS
jgi:8-hydroxy-5-deazaflavin:NADPH oxidoreductase